MTYAPYFTGTVVRKPKPRAEPKWALIDWRAVAQAAAEALAVGGVLIGLTALALLVVLWP